MRSTNTTAQLHPEEKAFALELAKKSNGKFTAEQIEAQMRLFFVKGTDITPATDRVASGSGIYGPAGNWMHMGDGKTSVQMFEKADQQVIALHQGKHSARRSTAMREAPGAIAPGGMSKDADPEWRAALAGFALFLYGVVFF